MYKIICCGFRCNHCTSKLVVFILQLWMMYGKGEIGSVQRHISLGSISVNYPRLGLVVDNLPISFCSFPIASLIPPPIPCSGGEIGDPPMCAWQCNWFVYHTYDSDCATYNDNGHKEKKTVYTIYIKLYILHLQIT